MPGTNQTEYQGGTVKVQQPTGGTWSSFLWNMPIITKDQVNHIEEYTDINAQIREEQSDGKSYLDMAKECFREIFGQGYEEENFPFTKETVDKAMTNMYVDGQTYRERFEIGDITEDNYELAICHMYFQMTTGAIAASHQRNGDVWRSDESYGLKYLHSHSKAFYRCRTAGTEARGRTSPAKWMEKVLEPIWLLQKGYADIPE